MSTTSSGQALQAAEWATPPMHVPDLKGGAYKTELVVSRSGEWTEKIIWWHGDDPRPDPHNHPWTFASTILRGGYTEDRWTPDPNREGVWWDTRHHYREGDVNHVPQGVFHNVRDVLPGTVTRMVCGEALPGNPWGYLLLDTGEVFPWSHERFDTDPPFIESMRALNPHLRPPS